MKQYTTSFFILAKMRFVKNNELFGAPKIYARVIRHLVLYMPSMKPSPAHSPKFALKLIKQHEKVAFNYYLIILLLNES